MFSNILVNFDTNILVLSERYQDNPKGLSKKKTIEKSFMKKDFMA